MPALELTLADHLTLGDLVELTRVECDAWRLSHVRRLLKLIELIGQGLAYEPMQPPALFYLSLFCFPASPAKSIFS